jgi:DNA-binding Lrp family transcriptional regulator
MQVSEYPGVNHNYEREHVINLWFVVTADNRNQVNWILTDIAGRSGIEVLDLPLQQSYHIDLGFSIAGDRTSKNMDAGNVQTPPVDDLDRKLLRALEDGLCLVMRPYYELANRIGWRESDVIARLQSLIDRGIITRFGCILRHRKLGYLANAMAVWDVPDDRVDDIAKLLARRDEVTLCYRRSRRQPIWPYNLFAMIHGQERDVVVRQIAQAAKATGLQQFASATLFSRSCFKQSAARLSSATGGTA